jgi:hypothetical protein
VVIESFGLTYLELRICAGNALLNSRESDSYQILPSIEKPISFRVCAFSDSILYRVEILTDKL